MSMSITAVFLLLVATYFAALLISLVGKWRAAICAGYFNK